MPDRRPQVDYGQDNPNALGVRQQGISEPSLRPAASPVDTFVRAARQGDTNAGNQAAQLAQALAQFSPGLARYAQGMQEKQNAQKLEEGKLAVSELSQQAKTYKDAVDKGMIPAHANPFFVAGVKEQYGRVVADQFASDMAGHIASNPDLQKSTDVKDFDATMTRAQEEWISQNIGPGNRDSFFNTGFSFRAQQTVAALRQQFSEQAGDRLVKLGTDAAFAEAKTHVIDSMNKGLPVDQAAADLQQWRSDMLAQGRSEPVIDHALVQAIGEAALDQQNKTRGLDAAHLLHLITGKDGTKLADLSPETSAYARKLSEEVIATDFKRIEQTKAYEKVDWDNRIEAAQVALVQNVLKNPFADASGILKTVSDIPEAAEKLTRTLASVRAAKENPQVRLQIFSDIWRDPKIAVNTILQRGARGEIGPDDVTFLVNQVQERDDRAERAADRSLTRADQVLRRSELSERAYDRVMEDPAFTGELGNMSAQFIDPFFGKTPELGQRQANAEALFRSHWLEWRASPEGQTASGPDRVKKAREMAQSVIDQQTAGMPRMSTGSSAPRPAWGGEPSKANAKGPPGGDTLFLTRADIAAITQKQSTPHAIEVLKHLGLIDERGAPTDGAVLNDFARQQIKLFKQAQQDSVQK